LRIIIAFNLYSMTSNPITPGMPVDTAFIIEEVFVDYHFSNQKSPFIQALFHLLGGSHPAGTTRLIYKFFYFPTELVRQFWSLREHLHLFGGQASDDGSTSLPIIAFLRNGLVYLLCDVLRRQCCGLRRGRARLAIIAFVAIRYATLATLARFLAIAALAAVTTFLCRVRGAILDGGVRVTASAAIPTLGGRIAAG